MNNYITELRTFFTKKRFVICVLLIAFLAYGFSVASLSISIDTLENERYLGSGNEMLSAGRFTFPLIGALLQYTGAIPQNIFIIKILSIFGLILTATNFCILFRRICGEALSDSACIVFVCVFLSYPLYNEIWEYTSATLCISFCSVCLSFSLLLIQDVLHRKEKKNAWKSVIPAALLLMLVCAGYEAVVPVYIWGVFAVLALQVIYGSKKEKTLKEILLQGICYAGVLVAGLILRLLVHRIILVVCNIEAQSNGATTLSWGTAPARELLYTLVIQWYRDYFLKAIIYFPLTELVVAAVVFLILGILACRKHGYTLLLPGVGMYLSLVILSLVQGTVSPYRTCQVFGIFVAFVAMYLVMEAETWKIKKAKVILLLLCGYLCFSQARYTNYFLTLNHIRSEEEAYVIRDIGTDLHRDYDMEKPVLFVGTYTLSDSVTEAASIPEDSLRWRVYKRIFQKSAVFNQWEFRDKKLSRELPDTNINSVLEWGTTAFGQEGMQNLFAYYGFDYVLPYYDLIIEEADAYVQETEMPAYPQAGYIRDVGDYIIVHIS